MPANERPNTIIVEGEEWRLRSAAGVLKPIGTGGSSCFWVEQIA
jgi:hypothetical protein